MTESDKRKGFDFSRVRRVFGWVMGGLVVSLIIVGVAGVESGMGTASIKQMSGWFGELKTLVGSLSWDTNATVTDQQREKMESTSNVKVIINTNMNVLPTQTPSPSVKPKAVVPTKTCYRYTVTHLDNSTSKLCYTKEDFNLLSDLGYKLNTAKTFMEFHQDAMGDYQAEYDRTKSNIYLDAKASAEASANREREKIGVIIGQMQEIERRGW